MLAVRLIMALLLLCLASNAAHAADGDFVWARGMGGTSGDGGRSIAVDSTGNVYTSGYFQGTVDFDPGEETFNLTSAGRNDIFVQKLDTSGNLVWAQRMGGTSDDSGVDIAVDSAGNIYTTGYFRRTVDFDPGEEIFNLTSAGERDSFVQKLNASGEFVWALRMEVTSSGIVLDNAGNVCTTGQFSGTVDFDPGEETYNLTSAGSGDIFVQKLDASGTLVWARGMGGPSGDIGLDVAVDGAGNVYTTGYFAGIVDFDPGAGTVNLASGLGPDFFVQKLNASGNFVWAWDTGDQGFDRGNSIAVDNAGNVLTTGYQGTNCYYDTIFDWYICEPQTFILKLDTDGELVWVRGPTTQDNRRGYPERLGIATDQSGNVYTTGYFEGTLEFAPGAGTVNLTSAGGTDIFVQKLDTSGNLVWARRMGGTDSEGGYAIAVDIASNVYTTGRFRGTANFDTAMGTVNLASTGSDDIFVSKLSGPETIPPNATSIAPFTTGPTNADSVSFTVTFDEDVQNFNDAADLVITHSGTTSNGATISGGPLVYTVDVLGIAGNGSFTLAVNTDSDVQDLAGNPLALSVKSAAVGVDNVGPVFSNVVANPSDASTGDTVSISFDSSEPVAGEPEVQVNGNPATRLSKADFAYEYTVQTRDVLGAATITISGADALGNVGALGESTLLDIVRAEGEGSVEGEGEGGAEGLSEGVVEGEGEGEGIVEGAGDGEGEGENPPAGCGGCNAAGGPMEKSLGDWLSVFLGFAVLLGAHLRFRSRLEG